MTQEREEYHINKSEDQPFESRTDLSKVKELADTITTELAKVIVGQHEMIRLLITALLADGHVLIEGVPGVAKTLTAKLLAAAVDTDFNRIQFTPDLMPADVSGTSVFNPKTTEFEFKKGPLFSNLVLIDEVNRSPAKTQSALFEAMEERQITADGRTYPLESPFMVIATQNPIEHEGTYRLPEAQLDRFLFRIDVPYPDLDQEVSILNGSYSRGGTFHPRKTAPVVGAEQLIAARDLIRKVHVSVDLMTYIATLIRQTRNSAAIQIGASPRAGTFLLRAAQVNAAIEGRDFITPEDVQQMVYPVLRHRLMLTPEKEMEGVSMDKVIAMTLEKVEVPR